MELAPVEESAAVQAGELEAVPGRGLDQAAVEGLAGEFTGSGAV